MASILWDDVYQARREGYDTRRWGQMEQWLPGGAFRGSPPSNVAQERAREIIKSIDGVIVETGFDIAEFRRLELRRCDERIRGHGDASVWDEKQQTMLDPVGRAMFTRGYRLKELTINWAGIVGVGMDK